MYRYSEGGKHRLTREMILRDLKEGDKSSSALAVGMMVASIAVSLIFTVIMALVSHSAGIGGKVVCGVFWLCAAVVIGHAVVILVRARKPLSPTDIRVVKCRLTAIEQAGYPYARERVRGEVRTVPRYLFFFEGFESYHPSQTELGLAEVGDEYFVVAYATKPTRPARLYRADTYKWDEALDI
ncbi:MAG: hypothetical protein IJA91_05255 [Clostridia bacterium]|nr:hypothetical protein [Clostridia bacterium]